VTTDLELAERGFTKTAWLAPIEDIEFDEWAALGLTLQQIDTSLPWWIGDWLNYGEWAWGEDYAQAIEITGMDISRLNNYKWIAGKVDKHDRNELLSWSHHRAVAPFEPDIQQKWLGKAEQNSWSVNELKREIQQENMSIIEPSEINDNGQESPDIEAGQGLTFSPVGRLRYGLKMLLERHLFTAPWDIDHSAVIQARNTFEETEDVESEDRE